MQKFYKCSVKEIAKNQKIVINFSGYFNLPKNSLQETILFVNFGYIVALEDYLC